MKKLSVRKNITNHDNTKGLEEACNRNAETESRESRKESDKRLAHRKNRIFHNRKVLRVGRGLCDLSEVYEEIGEKGLIQRIS